MTQIDTARTAVLAAFDDSAAMPGNEAHFAGVLAEFEAALRADTHAAIDTLADAAVARNPNYEHPEKLRAWVAGAVEVQFTEPDYEQVEHVELEPQS